VGSTWNKETQIDVTGINTMERTLVLGECKWTLGPVDRQVMAKLVEEKTELALPKKGKWKVYFLGFSRSGWTRGASAYQEEINRQPIQGENWSSAGIRLLSLDEVDEGLAGGNV
jgi:hypothetical protein